MKNEVVIKRIGIAMGAALILAACQTVSMPKLDFIKTPEFSVDAANIDKSYPRVAEAPEAPTDVRTAEQWDQDVRTIQALRDAPRPDGVEEGFTTADDQLRYEALKAKVHAYKADDPASGPVQGFPDYRPRR